MEIIPKNMSDEEKEGFLYQDIISRIDAYSQLYPSKKRGISALVDSFIWLNFRVKCISLKISASQMLEKLIQSYLEGK